MSWKSDRALFEFVRRPRLALATVAVHPTDRRGGHVASGLKWGFWSRTPRRVASKDDYVIVVSKAVIRRMRAAKAAQ